MKDLYLRRLICQSRTIQRTFLMLKEVLLSWFLLPSSNSGFLKSCRDLSRQSYCSSPAALGTAHGKPLPLNRYNFVNFMNLSKSLYRHIFHNIYFEKKKIFFRFFEIFRVEYPLNVLSFLFLIKKIFQEITQDITSSRQWLLSPLPESMGPASVEGRFPVLILRLPGVIFSVFVLSVAYVASFNSPRVF